MKSFILRSFAALVLAAHGLSAAQAAPSAFMATDPSFVIAALGVASSQKYLSAHGVEVVLTNQFSDMPGALGLGKAFGVQAVGTALLCPEEDPCEVVFLTDTRPAATVYANRQALAALFAKHGDSAGLKWLSDTVNWQEGKRPDKPPLYRAANLLAGALVAGPTECGVFPSTAPMSLAWLSSEAMTSDVSTSPKLRCVSTAGDVGQNEIGFTSGVKGAGRLKLLCDGAVVVAHVPVPQNAYVSEDLDCFHKIVKLMGVDEIPPFPVAGIVIPVSATRNKEAMDRVRAVACANLMFADGLRNPDPTVHGQYVALFQTTFQHGGKPATRQVAEALIADLLKSLNPTGTLPDDAMASVAKAYATRSGLMGDTSRSLPPLRWDFSQVPTLRDCIAAK